MSSGNPCLETVDCDRENPQPQLAQWAHEQEDFRRLGSSDRLDRVTSTYRSAPVLRRIQPGDLKQTPSCAGPANRWKDHRGRRSTHLRRSLTVSPASFLFRHLNLGARIFAIF